jgi:protein involved in polysaccharide export with SLBB domain
MRKDIKHILTTAGAMLLLVVLVAGSARPEADKLKPLDVISVKFILNSKLDETQFIRPDGMITLQAVGDVPAAGLTPEEPAERITRKSLEANLFSKELPHGGVWNYRIVTIHLSGMSEESAGKQPTEPNKLKP